MIRLAAAAMLLTAMLGSASFAATAQQKAATCKFGADNQKLTGAARAKFMKEKAEAAKLREEQAKQDRLRRVSEAVDAADDAYETDDPARAEQMAEEAAKKLQEQKPPRR